MPFTSFYEALPKRASGIAEALVCMTHSRNAACCEVGQQVQDQSYMKMQHPSTTSTNPSKNKTNIRQRLDADEKDICSRAIHLYPSRLVQQGMVQGATPTAQ